MSQARGMEPETPEGLAIKVERGAPTARLALDGEVDLATAPKLSAAFADLLEDRPDRIELDCANLRFLDSSGLQVLVAAWDSMKDRATMPVVLTNVSPLIKQVLEACGLRNLLME